MSEMTALVLEDSQTQANIITRLITSRGWGALHCLTPREAVDALKTISVQALFLDVFVGTHNTISLLPQFRRLAPSATITLMTAGSGRESLEKTLASARQARADFVLKKPFGEAQISTIICDARTALVVPQKPKHVLVIDDSGPILTLSKRMLEQEGYRVSVAASMEIAFKNTDIANVDVVVCDVFMPGMGGLKGMRHIKAVWPHVRIIAMSAGADLYVSDDEALGAAQSPGADARIKKPFSPDDLLGIVALLLEAEAEVSFLE